MLPTLQINSRCIVAKGFNAILMPQLSCGDFTVIRLSLNLVENKRLELLIGSVDMSYDNTELLPQRERSKG